MTTSPTRLFAIALSAAFGLSLVTTTQAASTAKHTLPESLATEAAARGETASATASLEGMVSLALAERETLAQVNDAGHWNRAQIASGVESRLNLTRAGLSQVRGSVADLPPEAREKVGSAMAAVDDAEEDLQAAIRDARGAEENEWTPARDELSATFTRYASAVMTAATTADAVLTQAPTGQ